MNYFEKSLSKKELSELVIGYAEENERLEAEIEELEAEIEDLRSQLDEIESPEDAHIPLSIVDPLLLRRLNYPLKVLRMADEAGVGVTVTVQFRCHD